MSEVKYDQSHHAGGTPAERIKNRLKNSGGEAGQGGTVLSGDPSSARRTYTNLHERGYVHSRGPKGGGGDGPKGGVR
jgi:hypothetical protein